MKNSTVELITPLLKALRSYSILDEVRPTAFYLEGKDFLHFHELEEDVVCDVWLTKGRVRMPVSTAFEQSELLDRIEAKLEALELHKTKKSGKKY